MKYIVETTPPDLTTPPPWNVYKINGNIYSKQEFETEQKAQDFIREQLSKGNTIRFYKEKENVSSMYAPS